MKKLILILIVLLAPGASLADSRADLITRAKDAAQVMLVNNGDAEAAIPESLLAKAECIGIFPYVVQMGFIFAGSYGRGLISCRIGDSWSNPTYFSVAGGIWGPQFGLESTDLVLIFLSPNAVRKTTHSKFTLGVDASVTAGPLGRDAIIGVDFTIQSEVYAYSRIRGTYAGLAVDGSVLEADTNANIMLYGRSASDVDFLKARYNATPHEVWPFVKALLSYAK